MKVIRPTDPQSAQTLVYWCISYLPETSGNYKQHVFPLKRYATFKDLSQRIFYETGSEIWNRYSYPRGTDTHHNNVVINSNESMELAINFMGDNAFDSNRGILVFVDASW
ncbi:hypothetical protein INT47_002910 [Mucor saturninus]|uniref:Uncharacterized protein n=1 Tax=Mucor saturninus TaxID=64648 RepID=A0A8H7QNC0_9FUNG|nr:hypothetical protein INT47_002910 [Mucor saturninus]